MAASKGAVTAVNGHVKTRTAVTVGEKRSIDSTDDKPASAKRPKLLEKTDYSRWRMLDEKGRQTWHYLEDDKESKEWPQSYADKYFLGLPIVCLFYRRFGLC